MAEWLKKQAEREAEKEQRRLERLQRKLSEPKHQFTDPEYQRQCHDLSERLEDSVIKGWGGVIDQGQAAASLVPCDLNVVCVFRSAGVLQLSGEGGRRLSSKETELRSERAAAQEEEEDGGGDVFLVSWSFWKHADVNVTTMMLKICRHGYRTGVGELLSSEDDEDEEEESPSTSSSGCGAAAVTMTTQAEEAGPEQSGR